MSITELVDQLIFLSSSCEFESWYIIPLDTQKEKIDCLQSFYLTPVRLPQQMIRVILQKRKKQ